MSIGIRLPSVACVLLSAGACAAGPSGWVTHGGGNAPFMLSFPADYIVNEQYTYEAMGPGKEIHGTSFTIPDRLWKGTNLSGDTRVSVEVLPNARACTPDLFQDNASGYYVETQGPITFNVSKTGDAGAGNFYEDDVYAVAGSKPCIAVRYFIHSHNIGNYDPGSVRAYDAEGLIREFDAIRKTLVIRR